MKTRCIAITVSLLVVLVLNLFSAPKSFPINKPVTIATGLSDIEVAKTLYNYNAIKYPLLTTLVMRVLGINKQLQAGRYTFDSALPVWEVIGRVVRGDYGTKRIKITIPEGFNNWQISELIGLDISIEGQGRLFPDTYYFDEFATVLEIRQVMQDNFRLQMGDVSDDVLIVASILEEEASSTKDRKIISGIMWKRLDIGMPLQVDVATVTYQRTGLPDTPITNPGKDAILASREPTLSSYLYYLSDKQGVIHYARTFEEHKKNRQKYGI